MDCGAWYIDTDLIQERAYAASRIVRFARRYVCGNFKGTQRLASVFLESCAMQSGGTYIDVLDICNSDGYQWRARRWVVRVVGLLRWGGTNAAISGFSFDTFVTARLAALCPPAWKVSTSFANACRELIVCLEELAAAFANNEWARKDRCSIGNIIVHYLHELDLWTRGDRLRVNDAFVHTVLLDPGFYFSDRDLDGMLARKVISPAERVGKYDVIRLDSCDRQVVDASFYLAVGVFMHRIRHCINAIGVVFELQITCMLRPIDFANTKFVIREYASTVASIHKRVGNVSMTTHTIAQWDAICGYYGDAGLSDRDKVRFALEGIYIMARGLMQMKANVLLSQTRQSIVTGGVNYERKRFTLESVPFTDEWLGNTIRDLSVGEKPILDLSALLGGDVIVFETAMYYAIMHLVELPPLPDSTPETMVLDYEGIQYLSTRFHAVLRQIIVQSTVESFYPVEFASFNLLLLSTDDVFTGVNKILSDIPAAEIFSIIRHNLLPSSDVYANTLQMLRRLWIDLCRGVDLMYLSTVVSGLLPSMVDDVRQLQALVLVNMRVHSLRYLGIFQGLR
jgi:hypothetical protein